jgi:hypothetical protein
MKRVITDFKKLSPELAAMFLQRYPGGYGDDDILAFKKPSGDWIEAVELPTSDTLYLVKINQGMTDLLAYFDDLASSDTFSESFGLETEYDGATENYVLPED